MGSFQPQTMGFFTSTSHFFMSLFTFIFSMLGSALFIFGLYGRFSSQWDDAASEHNGQLMILVCIFLGLGLFVNAFLGSYGANSQNKFCLVIFMFVSLACAIVAAWESVVLFGYSDDSNVPSVIKDHGDDVTKEITGSFTADQMTWVNKNSHSVAIFLACVAGAEALLFICALILAFQRRRQYLPSHYIVSK